MARSVGSIFVPPAKDRLLERERLGLGDAPGHLGAQQLSLGRHGAQGSVAANEGAHALGVILPPGWRSSTGLHVRQGGHLRPRRPIRLQHIGRRAVP